MSSGGSEQGSLKRRRVDCEGDPPSTGQTGEEGRTMAPDNMKAMFKSAVKELMDHSNSQMASLQSKMDLMMDKMNHLEAQNAHLKASVAQTQGIVHDAVISDLPQKIAEVRERMDSRLDDVEYRLKYHEVIMKNQNWKYPAIALPSQDYWDSIVHVWGAEETLRFLDKIEEETTNMRHGRGDGQIELNHTVSFNDAFLPHWKEFCDALGEYDFTLRCAAKDERSNTELALWCIQIPETVLSKLSMALRSTHFQCLSLTHNNFGAGGIKFVTSYLEHNPILEQLHLEGNPIDYRNDLERLCKNVERHPSIESMTLENCVGRDLNGFEMLCSIMNAGSKKLKFINLENSNISTRGSTFLSDFLATNTVLRGLCLRSNDFNDDDATLIAAALKSNSNLRQLNLEDNTSIEIVGLEALRKAKLDDTCLNSAASSNHTCLIHLDEMLDSDSMDSLDFKRKAVRSKKIFSILSSRNRKSSNVEHLDNVPLGLLPEMLCSIDEHSKYHLGNKTPDRGYDDVESLSIVYEILRRWENAFSVYESLSMCCQAVRN